MTLQSIEKCSIAIVEDDATLLNYLNLMFSRTKKYSVTNIFQSAENVLACIDTLTPNVMIVDINLPGMSGIDLIKKITSINETTKTIAFTGDDDKETIFSAIRAGAHGYILKNSSPEELMDAIDEVNKGGAPVSSRVARILFDVFQHSGEGNKFILSKREKEIISSLNDGLSYTEIGDKLCISPHTVHSHVKRIFKKLGVSNRREAFTIASIRGII